ncbi:competence protein CoiA family protein [Chlorobaculum thiosulfatiphilum]|nr:competence protein CoiA family protein [Chlorobaculum thiosulfatiphilum]
MFKALDVRDNSEVVILGQKWLNSIKKLRELDHQNILVCQGCKQPVRVRAGEKIRKHFAHKHLENCSYEDESAILRNSRAVLYEWLVGKFDKNVTIEKQVDGTELFRPIDCWVTQGSKVFAYWIIDSKINPDKRITLQNIAKKLRIHFHLVFCSDLLHTDQDNPNKIFLTTTEREFIQRSKYDEAHCYGYSAAGGSLHYLDAENRKLITFRNLLLNHKPQVYTGCNINSDLGELLVSPKTGEFVHKGEQEKWQKNEEEIRAVEEESIRESSEKMKLSDSSFEKMNKKKKCEICGEMTDDWLSFNAKTGLCKCSSCFHQGKF